MTYDEILERCTINAEDAEYIHDERGWKALRAVVELHKPLPIVNGDGANCVWCQIAGVRETPYPCPTIQAIEKELA